jgi:hypothetical protein
MAVSAKRHLIGAHEVSNVGIVRDQPTSIAKLARSEMSVDKLTAVADRGYYDRRRSSRATRPESS